MSAISSNPFALLAQGEDIVVPPGPKKVQQQPPTSKKGLEKKINAAKREAKASSERNEASLPPRYSTGREEPGYEKRDNRGAPRGGRGKAGGGAGGRGFGNRPPRREHDRHSATGIVDSEKKITQGWGASTATYDEDNKGEPRADEEGKEAPFAPIEEEPVKTLDQYLAEKGAKKIGESREVRRANEGVDDAKWKDAKPLVKDEEAYFAGKSDAGSKKAKSKKTKAVLDIEQTFADERRGGGRGGRGGASRGAARGGNRGGRGGRQNNGSGVNVDDQSAFPELGA